MPLRKTIAAQVFSVQFLPVSSNLQTKLAHILMKQDKVVNNGFIQVQNHHLFTYCLLAKLETLQVQQALKRDIQPLLKVLWIILTILKTH